MASDSGVPFAAYVCSITRLRAPWYAERSCGTTLRASRRNTRSRPGCESREKVVALADTVAMKSGFSSSLRKSRNASHFAGSILSSASAMRALTPRSAADMLKRAGSSSLVNAREGTNVSQRASSATVSRCVRFIWPPPLHISFEIDPRLT